MWCCHCGGRWPLLFRLAACAGGSRTAASGFNSRFPAGGSLGNMKFIFPKVMGRLVLGTLSFIANFFFNP
jgi:hypothetical protein